MRTIFLALALLAFPAHSATPADVLAAYRDVSHALAYDKLDEVEALAGKLAALSEALGDDKLAGAAKDLGSAAAAGNEREMRYKMSAVSEGAVWMVKRDPKLHSAWQLYRCPMVNGAFQFWMQPVGEKMANPYMGTQMLACGVKRAWNKFP